MLNIKDAAIYLGATVSFLRTQVWNNKLPYIRFGHRLVFDVNDLNKFVDKMKEGV
jgi:excisionase family DNA binding protein